MKVQTLSASFFLTLILTGCTGFQTHESPNGSRNKQPSHASENDSSGRLEAEGKWRCEMHEYQFLSRGAEEQGDFKWSDRAEGVVGTSIGPNFVEWFELDLDVDPKQLYFCSRSGCATGSFAHRDPAVLIVNIGTGVVGYEGMEFIFSITAKWKIAFVIQVMEFPLYRADILIFSMNIDTVSVNAVSESPQAVVTDLYKANAENFIRFTGKCTQIKKLSEPGNPIEWVYDSGVPPEKLQTE